MLSGRHVKHGGREGGEETGVRCAWEKFKKLAPFLMTKAPSMKMKGQVYRVCIRSLLYGCETWAMRAELESKMERTEMRMIKWMCRVSLKEIQPTTEQ